MRRKMYNVALYIRLSRKDGDKVESNSVANQRKLLRRYVEEHEELFYYDEYVDDDYSGLNFDRPGFARMIEDIERENVNCIIVKDLSRFCRNHIDGDWYLERYFPEKGVRFIAVTDGVDNEGYNYANYDMLTPFRNMLNENYARDISRKIHASLDAKRKSGEFVGAFASYGYVKDPEDHNRLIVDPEAADVVRRIFQMWTAGYGQVKIAHTLNEEGIPCPSEYKQMKGLAYSNGNRLSTTYYWTYSTIHNILHKEIYTGDMVQGKKQRYMKSKTKTVPEDEYIIVKNTHEAIIDKETWERARARFAHRTRELDLDSNNSIFAGYLKCADCGRALVKDKETNGRLRYRCGTYVRMGRQFCTPHVIQFDVLNQVILDDLNEIIKNLKNLRKALCAGDAQAERTPVKSAAAMLEIEISKMQRLKQNTYEDYKEGLLTKEEYFIYKNDYVQREEQLKQQLKKMKESSSAMSPEQKLINASWAQMLLKKKKLQSLDRQIIAIMVKEIKIYENRTIEITYNYDGEIDWLLQKSIEVKD